MWQLGNQLSEAVWDEAVAADDGQVLVWFVLK